MALVEFWHSLHSDGNLTVLPLSHIEDEAERRQLAAAIVESEVATRLDLPGPPPGLVLPAAIWAVRQLHTACQIYAYRDVPAEAIAAILSTPCPVNPSPTACYSVDLAFQTLPDLIALATASAADDPLVAGLLELSRQWPLSSVGVAGSAAVNIEPFWCDLTLRRLYCDRVVLRSDLSRGDDPRVADQIAAAVGNFRELATRFVGEALKSVDR